jgi:large subunit ribosomal protein L21e
MVAKSHGPRRRTREKFRRSTRSTVNQFLKKFSIGSNVAIYINSSSQKGMPFRRFHGLTGKVVGIRGRAYIVEIHDGGKLKKIITRPEHLKSI